MKVIWSGVATSATRIDFDSGLPLEYRLIVYDDGQAQCSCPAFAFMGSRNPKIAARDRLRVRCKHLEAAFASGRVADLTAQPAVTVDPVPVGRPPTVTPAPPVAPDEDDLFGDDDLSTPHLVR